MENISFSLALSIVTICSHPEDRGKTFDDLKSLLISRAYKTKSVEAAIEKVRVISREEAFQNVTKSKHSDRPVFVVNFDPRLPSIIGIIRKRWRTMTSDPRLAEIFPLPPLPSLESFRILPQNTAGL